jgi:uncharacterized protein (TIGR04255 family)
MSHDGVPQMSVIDPPLEHAPIIEAVVEINCDLPLGMDLLALEEAARKCYGDVYPVARRRLIQELQFRQEGDAAPESSVDRAVDALQFATIDERQLVQVRREGFSFNRLAPYSSLDEYLPEIQRTWLKFVEIARPVQVRRIGLRYINRILLPTVHGEVQLDEYLAIGPRLPVPTLTVAGFLHQYVAVEPGTRNQVSITMVMHPEADGTSPLLFDIDAFRSSASVPEDWSSIRSDILALRALKNRVFLNSLTEKCLNLFRQP